MKKATPTTYLKISVVEFKVFIILIDWGGVVVVELVFFFLICDFPFLNKWRDAYYSCQVICIIWNLKKKLLSYLKISNKVLLLPDNQKEAESALNFIEVNSTWQCEFNQAQKNKQLDCCDF